MANKKTRPVSIQEFEMIIQTIDTGFISDTGERVKPNPRVSAALIFEANTGLRVNDAIKIRLCDIRTENGKYKLKVKEQKTQKIRNILINSELYIYLQNYCLALGIQPTAKLFDLTARQIQKILQKCCKYLNLNDIGTHSMRKMYASQLFYQNNCNALLIQKILGHSSIAITQRYLGLEEGEIQKATENYVMLPS